MDGSIDCWILHSAMSDPGGYRAAIAALPADIGALIDTIQGMLVHADWVKEYGLDETKLDATARRTLPVIERLDDVLRRNSQPLEVRRAAEKRSTGTCRDYALMLCSFLRCRGIPARVRCGFAAYFSDGWEDHWVCEYWDAKSAAWHLADPQIDQVLRHRSKISFAPSDVPRRFFMTAGEAWLQCRHGKSDPSAFGHGDVTGLWFMKVNVLRDHHVLNGRETSNWDSWREAPHPRRTVFPAEMELLDALAARPEQTLVEIGPDW
ncbi:MAG: transglutaminase domain-containing protein [Rhizobiaceae bacterium]|nr:transglutaminase domain-containing protein [Rhizobiaceae bacterium]